MALRRVFAWWVYTALTAPIGLLAHFAFEAYSRRDSGFSPFEPDHVALLSVLVGFLAAVVVALRRGTRDERRNRITLLRACMPRGIGLIIATGTVQLAVAAFTLSLENLAVEPTRAGSAVAIALATALAGAFAFFCVEDVVLITAAGLCASWIATSGESARLVLVREAPFGGRIAVRHHRGRSPPFRP
jgi:hypothetical protein